MSLALTICLALGAFAAVGSAAAATQHWASATSAVKISPGTEQSFTGVNNTSVQMEWSPSGVHTIMSCGKLSTSGTASNSKTEGDLSSTSLGLSECSISTPHCAFKGGSIPFQTLTGYARNEGGERRLVLKPQSGTTMAVLQLQGAGGECAWGSSLTMSGYIEAIQVAGHPGVYEIPETPSHLTIGTAVKMLTEFSLSASGQSLQLSSEGSEGPYWYFGQGEWSLIKAGEQTNYWNSNPVPLTLSAKVGLFETKISGCEGLFNGKVENPVGGGAGTATAGLTPGFLGGCSINVTHCYVEGAPTNLLSGVATEIGGVPAVEWSPSSGTTVLSFELGSVGGKCPLISSSPLNVKGKLITTSQGNGQFSLTGSELKVGSQNATLSSGEFGLETEFGKSLRLQP
jgi:hypothetical protein